MLELSEMDTAMCIVHEESDSHSETSYEFWQTEMLQEAAMADNCDRFHEIKQEELDGIYN